MPTQITAYQARNGSIHANACLAATNDLESLINGSPLAENKPFARVLLTWLQFEADIIISTLLEYREACPADATTKGVEEGHKGPKVIRRLATYNELTPHGVECEARKTGVLDDCDCVL